MLPIYSITSTNLSYYIDLIVYKTTSGIFIAILFDNFDLFYFEWNISLITYFSKKIEIFCDTFLETFETSFPIDKVFKLFLNILENDYSINSFYISVFKVEIIIHFVEIDIIYYFSDYSIF